MPNIYNIIENYNLDKITIGVLGGHSALDVCAGAKKMGLATVCVAQKGRQKTYEQHFKTRDNLGCVDQTIVVDKFADITNPQIQDKLRSMNTIFVHNRYFWVYCNWLDIENKFALPIYGSRQLVRLEERDVPNNQYQLLQEAKIRIPKIFASFKDIDRLVIVKVNQKQRTYERAFFLASSPQDFSQKVDQLLQAEVITKKALQTAVIEEFLLGTQVNLNFFYSNLNQRLELMGTDTRRQTNLDGFLRLTADSQLEALKYTKPTMIETGHIAVTLKESLIEKAMDIGQKFVAVTKQKFGQEIIGPFALQGSIVTSEGQEQFVIFDVSMRIPGSPGIKSTPYTEYLFGQNLSYGQRIAMEICQAVKEGRLLEILT
jgi:5-formaminoimidazole-4-carboxamide-1-(beta)-D-ribofuranosyl 5'-monophosphate synthetase